MGELFDITKGFSGDETIVVGVEPNDGVEKIVEGGLIEPVSKIDKILFNAL